MYADGSRHTGQWYKNMKHGPAVFISDSGQNFEGRFEKDVMVGTLSQVIRIQYRYTPVKSEMNKTFRFVVTSPVSYDAAF